MFADGGLSEHYQTQFALTHTLAKYSIQELDRMIPFEKEILLIQIQEQIKKEIEAKTRQAQQCR